MTRHRALALLALLAALFVPSAAQAATPKANLVDIEDEVMCVTCKIPLNIAEAPQADDERAVIRDLIAQGKTKPEIKAVLVEQFGPDVIALPETSGVGITAYAIPLLLGALVVAGLVVLVPRWRQRTPAGIATSGANAATDLSAEDAARLDADLSRYDG